MLKNLAKGALNKAKTSVGLAAMREAEELLGIRFDPAPAYLFYVSISGLIVGLFTGCDGLSVTRSVEEFREGGVNDHAHVLPGPVSVGMVSLRRGLSISRVLWDWFTDGLYDNKVNKLNMSIVQGAPGGNLLPLGGGLGMVKTWNLDGAYPVSWSLSSLDVSNTNQVAIETVQIACQSISLQKLAGIPLSPTALLK
jgi:phage tail-like protein